METEPSYNDILDSDFVHNDNVIFLGNLISVNHGPDVRPTVDRSIRFISIDTEAQARMNVTEIQRNIQSRKEWEAKEPETVSPVNQGDLTAAI